jgi:magnesium transporter
LAEPSDNSIPTAADLSARSSEALYGLRPALVRAVIEAAEAGDHERVRRLVEPLHYSDLADLIERLNSDQRKRVVAFIGPDLDPDAISELDDAVREEVIQRLSPEQIAEVLSELETDHPVALIEDLDQQTQNEVLAQVEPEERADIQLNLTFPDDSAGRMMQPDPVSSPETWTVGSTIDHMRETPDLPDDFYDIFVVDSQQTLKGTLPLNLLLRAKRPVRVSQIMTRDVVSIPATMDREEVARRFRDRDLVSAPVVDARGRLVGMITIDDVVDVIEEEAEEDMLRLSGVQETDFYKDTIETTRRRFTWLSVNLVTAILASLVIGFFARTIEQLVALAILMPIVASMGGNAGTQTLTVTVRAIATRELAAGKILRFIGKEAVVGATNGVLFALIMGAIAWLWFSSAIIGVVIGLAMTTNLIVAGFSGAVIPLMLERRGIDPAVASSVILTTVTDVVGFLTFLGLATIILL